jgi:hypothetical protein
MAKRQLKHTEIIIYARVTKRNGQRELTVLPFRLQTFSLSLSFIIWVIAAVAALFTTVDKVIDGLYRFLFVGWEDDLRLIWEAFSLMLRGKVYVWS